MSACNCEPESNEMCHRCAINHCNAFEIKVKALTEENSALRAESKFRLDTGCSYAEKLGECRQDLERESNRLKRSQARLTETEECLRMAMEALDSIQKYNDAVHAKFMIPGNHMKKFSSALAEIKKRMEK